jgi:hypothetical protein
VVLGEDVVQLVDEIEAEELHVRVAVLEGLDVEVVVHEVGALLSVPQARAHALSVVGLRLSVEDVERALEVLERVRAAADGMPVAVDDVAG